MAPVARPGRRTTPPAKRDPSPAPTPFLRSHAPLPPTDTPQTDGFCARTHSRRQRRITRLVRRAQPYDAAVSSGRVRALEQRRGPVVGGCPTVEQMLQMGSRPQTQPGSARLVAARKTITPCDPELTARIQRRGNATRSQRHDHARFASTRAEQRGEGVAFDGKRTCTPLERQARCFKGAHTPLR